MVFTSKTLIPGKTPIGQNKDGSYIYDGIQSVPNMSFMPAKNTFDASKQMSVTPKPIYTPPTPLPMTKSPLGFNIMPQVNKKVAQKVNAPVKDTLNFRTKIKEDSPRVQQLRQHFRALEQKGEFQLNDKQTEYIRKFKAKYPDYANVPDVSLYSKIILAEPKAMEQYGNIGQKGIIESIVGLPLAMAKTGSDAIMEAQDVFQERQKTLNKSGNLGLTNLLASASAGRALGTGVLGMAGDVLNVASPLINPETGVTSVTEGLTRDLGTMVEKVPEEYRQQISDLITKYPKITATLGTAFDLSNLIPFLGALGKAKSASQVDDIIKTVKARPATRFRGEVSPTAFEAGMNRNLISDVAQIPVKTTKATLKGTAKAGEFTGETAIATGVGISKPSQQAIKEAPELYKQARTGALTRETATEEVVSTLKKRLGELSDTGKEYNTIRQSTVTMPKQDFGKILDDFFKENDISKIDMPIKDRKVVQQAIDYIAEYDDILSAKNGLSLRRKLDDLADWSEATGEGKRLIRKLRGKVDEYLGGKIPGLKELDAKYAPEVSFLKKVKSGILNADGSIKDSAISYVANIVGKGKEMKLDRLEELLPGIGQKVRALKAFEEVQAISSIKTGSIMRQLSGVALGNTVVPGFGAIAGFIATNPNIVAFALEKYGMAKKAIKELLKKGAKITSDEAVKVKQAVDAVPSKEVSTFLLGAGEQRKLLMPPKQGDSILTRLSKSDSPTPSSNSPSVSSVVSNTKKLLPEPQKLQKTPGKSSVLNQLSKGKSKSASKKVNNPIIQKLAKKQETPKTPQVDTELASLQKLQESLPGLPKVEVPADYKPTDGLPTGAEFESTILPTKTKTNKIPSPDIKRPQIRGIDLGIRSDMIDSLKQEGIFTDSFFAITDQNLSKKFIDYAEQKAIKKGISTSGKEVSMSRLLDTAKKSADTPLVPKEYVRGTDGEKGIYLRFDLGGGNKVAVNSSYTDIFFKNFDDVTFKGSNEVSPVIVYSKGKDVGLIMPIKDPYGAKEVLGDFTTTTKQSLPLSQKSEVKEAPKTPQVEGKTDDYLYHGTSQFAFEKIQKEGIKPQGRGVSSLSKTEEYSRNWAFPEATGTKGVMLRVKKDFMKDKIFNTKKPRPKSDEMYEVLTKETIPPEAIEVFKDGKWQPLVKKQETPKTPNEIQSLENEIQLKEQYIKFLGENPKKGSIAYDEKTRQIGEMGALKDRLDYLKSKTPQVEGKIVGFTKKSHGVYEKTIGDREIRVSIGGKDIYPNLKDGEYSVSIHENKLKPDGTWYDPGYGQSGTYGSKEKIMKFLEKEGIDGNEFFPKPSSTPMADGNIGITKKEFIEATRGQHNSIRDIGGIKVARVDFHDGKEWKIVKTDNFDDISPDTRVKGNEKSEKIIAEFETREELMNYLYNKKSLPLSSKSEVKYSEYNPPTKAKISNIFRKNGFTLSETRKGRRGTEYTGGVKIDVIKKDVKYGKDWVEEPTGKVKITSQKKYHVTGSQEVHSLDSVKEFLNKQGIEYTDNGESLIVDLLKMQ